jgi:hypothetical protein
MNSTGTGDWYALLAAAIRITNAAADGSVRSIIVHRGSP